MGYIPSPNSLGIVISEQAALFENTKKILIVIRCEENDHKSAYTKR